MTNKKRPTLEDRMETFMKNFEKSRSDAEAKMFNENPDLSNDYLKVFYGPEDERFKIENGELSKYYEERYSTENLLKILHEFNNKQKYRWHDLRKNPKDVPENQNTVLTSVNGVVCLNFYSNGRWYETNGLEDDINMDAWREIEPFEDDNNDN